jgi:hypothetical protein
VYRVLSLFRRKKGIQNRQAVGKGHMFVSSGLQYRMTCVCHS